MYFDNIVPNEFGVRRKFWYFLDPRYWVPNACGASARSLGEVERGMLDVGEGAVPLDQDVADEEGKMKSLANHRTGEEAHGGM